MGIRVTLAGATGKVGKALATAIAESDDLELAGAVSRSGAGRDLSEFVDAVRRGLLVTATLEEALETASDVVIDFTKPTAVRRHVEIALAAGRHVVVGTSGLTADDYAAIGELAREKQRGVLAAGNFSITATLLRRFALEAARYVDDVEVIDYAPAGKTDVPSGTARELAEHLGALRGPSSALPSAELTGDAATRGAAIGSPRPVQVHSVRLPSYALSCEAIFGADNERLVIRHDAGASSAPYVSGTLLAVRKVSGFVGLRRGLDSILD